MGGKAFRGKIRAGSGRFVAPPIGRPLRHRRRPARRRRRKSAGWMSPCFLRKFRSPPHPNIRSGSSSPRSLARALARIRGKYGIPAISSPKIGTSSRVSGRPSPGLPSWTVRKYSRRTAATSRALEGGGSSSSQKSSTKSKNSRVLQPIPARNARSAAE